MFKKLYASAAVKAFPFQLATFSQPMSTRSFSSAKKALFVLGSKSHIINEHLANWSHKACDHKIIYEEDTKNLDNIIKDYKPEVLVLLESQYSTKISQFNKELQWIHLMNTSCDFENTILRISDRPNVKLTSSRISSSHALSEYIIAMTFLHLKGLKTVIQKNQLRSVQLVTPKKLAGSKFLFLGYDYALYDTFRKIQEAFNCEVTVLDNFEGNSVPNMTKENKINVQRKAVVITELLYVASFKPNNELFVRKQCDCELSSLRIKNLVNISLYKEFREMNNNAIMINVGSFKHIDQLALLAALINSKILGASIDLDYVPDQKSPLFDCERLVLTHNSADYYGLKWFDVFKFWNENFERFVKGDSLLGAVDKKTGRYVYY